MGNKYLLEQYKLHPTIEGYDILKFTFQAVFGAEHLLKDLGFAKEYLHKEIESVKGLEEKNNERLYEQISEDYVRLNIYPFIYVKGYKEDELFELFVRTASEKHGSEKEFDEEIIKNIITLKEKIDYDKAKSDTEEYLDLHKYQPVTHSSNYRENEKPHYRVIKKEYFEAFLKEKEK